MAHSLKHSAFNLRHQRKAERVQRLVAAQRFAKGCVAGFSRNALTTLMETEGKMGLVLRGSDAMTAKFPAIGKVGRYVLVGPPGWMRRIMQNMGLLAPIETRALDQSGEAAAWAGVGRMKRRGPPHDTRRCYTACRLGGSVCNKGDQGGR